MTDAPLHPEERPPQTHEPGHVPFGPGEVERTIPERFRDQVEAWPDRPAVRAGGTTLTYLELADRACSVARRILGCAADGPGGVALLLPQGIELVSAILGTLEAGKHYVALDAGYPLPLLEEIVRDAEVDAVLTCPELERSARSITGEGTPVVVLGARGEEGEVAGKDGLGTVPAGRRRVVARGLTPDSLAYVFYTSGSTGRPKAVVDSHRNVLHNVLRYTNALRIAPTDRMTLLQSAAFSGSVSSLFGALLNGACSLPLDLHGTTPRGLARWLRDERVSIYHSVPAVFRAAMAEGDPLPDLRVVRLEGDQATHLDLRCFEERAPRGALLANGLGTTETGLVSQFFFRHGDVVDGPVVPVGYPVTDIHVAVVGPDRRPVPIGEVGEIAVSSPYLALGYRGAPELTQRRFRTDPDDPSRRVYLTGDLGRLRPDGCLEHLGRLGSRVKIRGHSVDLAEIEHELRGLAEVADAAAVVDERPGLEPRLVAYVVPAGGRTASPRRLRSALAERVAPPLVPSTFVEVTSIPLTRHGKVDRGALPRPARHRRPLETPAAEPRDLLENQIATVWEELLGVAPVGVRDDFLELGGDSLTATRMLGRLEDELGEDLPPDWLLTAATVEELAATIRSERPRDPTPVTRVQEGGGGRPFFFVHGDYLSGGYYCRALARHMGDHVPFYALPPSGRNGNLAAGSYEEMAGQHVSAIRSIQPRGPYRLGGTCNGGLVAFEIARRLVAEGDEVEALALFVASARNLRFRTAGAMAERLGGLLGRGPALRRRLLRLLTRAEGSVRARGRLGFLLHAAVTALGVRGRPARATTMTEADVSAIYPLREHYKRMDVEYLPGTYPGAVTLLWPDDEDETAEEAVAWWRTLSPRVELREIPSGHQACLTRNVDLLAAELVRCLDQAEGTGESS